MKNLKKVFYCVCLALVMMMFVTVTAKEVQAGPEKPIVLTFAGSLPEHGMVAQKIWIPWFKEIEEATKGRVRIQPYYAGSLCPYPENYNAVVTGLADIANVAQSHTTGKFPLADIMLLSSWDKISYGYARASWELYQKFPEIRAEYSDVKVLAMNSVAPSMIAATKKPIYKMEDCKNQKWNVGGKIFKMRAEALGGVPVQIPPPEVYSAMEKGVTDGGIIVPEWFWTFKLGEVVKSVTTVPFNVMPHVFPIRWKKWNSLPPDVQKAIEEVSGARFAERTDREEMLSYFEGLEAAQKEFGVEVIHLQPDELARWVKADKAVTDNVIAELTNKGFPAQKIYDEWLALEAKYSDPKYKPKR